MERLLLNERKKKKEIPEHGYGKFSKDAGPSAREGAAIYSEGGGGKEIPKASGRIGFLDAIGEGRPLNGPKKAPSF